MEILDKKQSELKIQKDGFYTYQINRVEQIQLTIEKQIHAQIIFELIGELDLRIDAQVLDHANVRILCVNKAKHSKVHAEYHLQENASLLLGLYELHDGGGENKTIAHLEEPFAKVEIISTSVCKVKRTYNIECIHHVHDTYSDMKNYEISDEGANYNMTASGNIKKGAYGSKSHQLTRILTLSEKQRSVAVPLLLIEENDVEASHANTMGKMAEEDLFYLQSRGISESSAKGLLILSYVLPIAEVIQDEAWQEVFMENIRSKVGI